MSKMIWLVIAVAGAAIVSTTGGCASLVGKSDDIVSIGSSPSDAELYVYNKKGLEIYHGRTPATITLKKGRGYFLPASYTAKVHKAGYYDTTVPVRQGLSGWYVFGNLFIGGLIGWVIVDPITGAMWTLKDAHVTLQPLHPEKPEPVSLLPQRTGAAACLGQLAKKPSP